MHCCRRPRTRGSPTNTHTGTPRERDRDTGRERDRERGGVCVRQSEMKPGPSKQGRLVRVAHTSFPGFVWHGDGCQGQDTAGRICRTAHSLGAYTLLSLCMDCIQSSHAPGSVSKRSTVSPHDKYEKVSSRSDGVFRDDWHAPAALDGVCCGAALWKFLGQGDGKVKSHHRASASFSCNTTHHCRAPSPA